MEDISIASYTEKLRREIELILDEDPHLPQSEGPYIRRQSRA